MDYSIKKRIKIWLLRKLIGSLAEDAIKSNNHILADEIIILEDVLKRVSMIG